MDAQNRANECVGDLALVKEGHHLALNSRIPLLLDGNAAIREVKNASHCRSIALERKQGISA